MAPAPWWIERVDQLLATSTASAPGPGELWHLCEQLEFVRENVEPALLLLDFAAVPRAEPLWAAFGRREVEVVLALREAVARLADRIRTGELEPAAFRSFWEALGYEQNDDGGGTPADDFLDAVSQVSRYTTGETRPEHGMPNMSSRACRIADFLQTTNPCRDDVVFDLGSGSGKLALTVAASAMTRVRGVEYGASYVTAAIRSAEFLGLRNLEFDHADVRDVDLSMGTIFYLYYPFNGEVAQSVAQTLGRLGRQKAITVYAHGPRNGFGEHFLTQVDTGALPLCDRRGEFSEVMVLRSRPG